LLKNFDLRHLKTSSANFAPDVLTFDSGHFVRVPHFSAVDTRSQTSQKGPITSLGAILNLKTAKCLSHRL